VLAVVLVVVVAVVVMEVDMMVVRVEGVAVIVVVVVLAVVDWLEYAPPISMAIPSTTCVSCFSHLSPLRTAKKTGSSRFHTMPRSPYHINGIIPPPLP
jgi:hypothetical protein